MMILCRISFGKYFSFHNSFLLLGLQPHHIYLSGNVNFSGSENEKIKKMDFSINHFGIYKKGTGPLTLLSTVGNAGPMPVIIINLFLQKQKDRTFIRSMIARSETDRV